MHFRKYYEIVKNGVYSGLAYRLEVFFSMLSMAVFLVLYYAIWTSVAASGKLTATVPMIMSYLAVARAISGFVFSRTERKIGTKVREGTIVNELKRPISFKTFLYLQETGTEIVELVFKSLPLMVIGMIFFGVKIPSPSYLLYFLISVVLAYNLSIFIGLSASMLVFWTKTGRGISMARQTLQSLFAGVYFPLFLLPPRLSSIFNVLPFQAIIDGPVSIFMADLSLKQIQALYIKQVAWMIFFVLLSEILWRKAKTKLTVQGG